MATMRGTAGRPVLQRKHDNPKLIAVGAELLKRGHGHSVDVVLDSLDLGQRRKDTEREAVVSGHERRGQCMIQQAPCRRTGLDRVTTRRCVVLKAMHSPVN